MAYVLCPRTLTETELLIYSNIVVFGSWLIVVTDLLKNNINLGFDINKHPPGYKLQLKYRLVPKEQRNYKTRKKKKKSKKNFKGERIITMPTF